MFKKIWQELAKLNRKQLLVQARSLCKKCNESIECLEKSINSVQEIVQTLRMLESRRQTSTVRTKIALLKSCLATSTKAISVLIQGTRSLNNLFKMVYKSLVNLEIWAKEKQIARLTAEAKLLRSLA